MKRVIVYAVVFVIALGLIVGLAVKRKMGITSPSKYRMDRPISSIKLKGEFDIQNAFINVICLVYKSGIQSQNHEEVYNKRRTHCHQVSTQKNIYYDQLM